MSLQADDHMIALCSICGRLLEFDGAAEQVILQAAEHAVKEHPDDDVNFTRVNPSPPG